MFALKNIRKKEYDLLNSYTHVFIRISTSPQQMAEILFLLQYPEIMMLPAHMFIRPVSMLLILGR